MTNSDSPPDEVARFKRRGKNSESLVDKAIKSWEELERQQQQRESRQKLADFEEGKREGMDTSAEHGSDREMADRSYAQSGKKKNSKNSVLESEYL